MGWTATTTDSLGRVCLCLYWVVFSVFSGTASHRSAAAHSVDLILMMATIEHRRQPSRGQTGSLRQIDRWVQFSSVITNINIVILLPVDGYLWLPVWASSSSKDAQAWSEKRKTNIVKIMMHLLDLFENDAILVLSIKYMRIQLNNKSGVWQQKNQIDQDWEGLNTYQTRE